jgi:predicted Fe-Mo cluster-binding NifX family protein
VQTAALIADRGVEVVLTGNCGPNAHRTLAAAGVKVFTGASGTVEEALRRFQAGELVAASDATVPPHFGMGQGRGGGRGRGGRAV